MEKAAVKIHELGGMKVIIKGGHLTGEAIDVVFNGTDFSYLQGRRIETKNTHGTGCTFSSAIAALLARGFSVPEAARLAKEYINGAIERSLELGHGVGPVNHFTGYMKRREREENMLSKIAEIVCVVRKRLRWCRLLQIMSL